MGLQRALGICGVHVHVYLWFIIIDIVILKKKANTDRSQKMLQTHRDAMIIIDRTWMKHAAQADTLSN